MYVQGTRNEREAEPSREARATLGSLDSLAQNGQAGQIILHHRIVYAAACVPASRGADERGASVRGLRLLRGEWLGALGREAARGGTDMSAQLQPAQRPGRHRLRSTGWHDAFGHFRRLNPLLTPVPDLLTRGAQLRIGERHGNSGQIGGFAQRRIPALLIEHLLDVGQVGRDHSGARRRGPVRCTRRTASSVLLWFMHESSAPYFLMVAPRRADLKLGRLLRGRWGAF